MSSLDVTTVVAGVVSDGNKVLLTRRKAGQHLAGLWEFPGGKLEQNETQESALARELSEEIGIVVNSARRLISIPFTYPGKSICLDVWLVISYSGTPAGLEAQELKWLPPSSLRASEMPPADKAVITALLLPSSYVISSGNAKSPTEFLSQLNIVLDKGYRLLQLRAKDLSAEAYAKLARNCLRDCSKVGASLMLNASAELVAALGASGMHLGSKALLNCTRRPLGDNYLVAASCHNRNEIQKAVDIGVDFIILSPVLPTPSHPDALPLAWAGFERLVANCPLPVYALGGMHTGYIGEAHSRGAQGVAGISAFWPPYHS